MLVLGQFNGDEITVAIPPSAETRYVVIRTLRVGGGMSRLGFKADRDIEIYRHNAGPKKHEGECDADT